VQLEVEDIPTLFANARLDDPVEVKGTDPELLRKSGPV
jgi:hypothetical protein